MSELLSELSSISMCGVSEQLSDKYRNLVHVPCCIFREGKDKDKDKEALFNVAYNVTDNISS